MAFDPRAWGVLAALALHTAVGAALALQESGARERPAAGAVEISVVESPPLPPVLPPPALAPAAPDPPPRPRPMVRHRLPKPPEPTAKPPPPPLESAPPVFGVTLDSVVLGDSGSAVPVGNAINTQPRSAALPPRVPPPGAIDGTANFFSPVSDDAIAEPAIALFEVKEDYPESARRMGFEGQVTLRVGIDRRGATRSVRVVRRAGHGFDEAAASALWRFKWTPARDRAHRALDCQITFLYKFELPR